MILDNLTNGEIYDLMKGHEAFLEDGEEEIEGLETFLVSSLQESEKIIELCEKELQRRGL